MEDPHFVHEHHIKSSEDIYEELNRVSKGKREELGLSPLYFDFDGKPIELGDYARLSEERKPDGRWRVALVELPNGWQVSTVWLGCNHNFLGQGPPLIFESMVFPQNTLSDAWCDRYSTREAALAGHNQIVEMVKAWRSPSEGGEEDAQKAWEERE